MPIAISTGASIRPLRRSSPTATVSSWPPTRTTPTSSCYVDWQIVAHNGDSGVYLRGIPQVQIWDPDNPRDVNNGAPKGSGALWNDNADNPGKWPLVKADNPVGEWNSFRIRMIGNRVWVWLNDKQTVDGQVHGQLLRSRQADPAVRDRSSCRPTARRSASATSTSARFAREGGSHRKSFASWSSCASPARLATAQERDAARSTSTALDDKDGVGRPISPRPMSTVKESGRLASDLSALEPTRDTMQIAILVDDNGTGIFRVGVARFIEALLGRAEFSISMVRGQTIKLVDYTTDTRQLSEAVAQLGAHPSTNDGNQLLDGITGAVARHGQAQGGPARSSSRSPSAATTSRRCSRTTRSTSCARAAPRSTWSRCRTRRCAPRCRPTRPADLLGEEHAPEGECSATARSSPAAIATRSRRSPASTTGLQQLAEQLKQQYVHRVHAADGVKPSKRVSVNGKRKGVTLRAPTHVPDKMF